MKRIAAQEFISCALAFILVFAVPVPGFVRPDCHGAEPSPSTGEQTYVCPMHPQVRSPKPGRCPICGMDLVPAPKAEPKQTAQPQPQDGALPVTPLGHASFELSLERAQLIGVKLGKVEKRELFREIRAPGRIAFDPELYTAQTEYQEALKQLERVRNSPLADVRHSARRMVESAKLRLKILGLSDKQIAALPGSKDTAPGLLLHQRGEDVWVYAEVFEMDLPLIKPGQKVEISTPAHEGGKKSGQVVSVDRVINPTTRTAKVRIKIADPVAVYRPESYVNTFIHVPLGNPLAVPFDAVLDTGEESWVFVKNGDRYEPRRITVRTHAGDWIAIESGLKAGEQIVTSANFLIDSESRLRAVTAPSGASASAAEPACPEGQTWHAAMGHCMPAQPGSREQR